MLAVELQKLGFCRETERALPLRRAQELLEIFLQATANLPSKRELASWRKQSWNGALLCLWSSAQLQATEKKKAHPAVPKISSKHFDQLSTKIRPNIKYETDRPDLGGSGIMDGLLKSGVFGSPYRADLKKGYEILSNPDLFAPMNKKPVKDAKKLVQYYKGQYKKAKPNGYKNHTTLLWRKWVGVLALIFTKPLANYPLQKKGGHSLATITRALQPPRTAAEIWPRKRRNLEIY